MKKALTVYFYRVKILREVEGGGTVTATREGTLMAPWPLTALDEITRMAVEEWKRPLQKIELYETDEHGELVATTTLGDRIDSILATHKALRPASSIAKMADRREENKAKPKVKLKAQTPHKTTTPAKLSVWNWSAECGSRYTPRSFTCPDMEKVTC